ncbi:MAG: glycoside hydrolase family 3 C-terminal domain-containing protein [Lachnospiraceae bacterium]|nr:glycoside hydrolase family 3 C-terminal domain-containing protein [Robinsoniella sp.]MDY3766275.1 glycoside hydrolase family 3 C-terminal domain-containing protein [Lachnospiraceae bacterium]
MKRKQVMALLLAAVMVCGTNATVFAAHTTDEVTEMETANSELSKKAATEGMVLLENDGVLPMAASGKVALFGKGVYNTVKGGTGSGDVNQREVTTVWEAFENAGYEITTTEYLKNAQADYEEKQAAFDAEEHESRWITYRHQDLEITDEELATAAEADTAIYVISRNSGEGDDRIILNEDGSYNLGDYYLSLEEEANLKKLASTFDKVIVCLNVGGVMDTTFYQQINEEIPDGLDALLLMSQGGQEIGTALIEVLTGEVNPSGKTVDTWAKSYSDYPASAYIGNADGDALEEKYSEGIYVGYRYFDTFGKEVSYPFGYGISYTTFDTEILGVEADAEYVTVTAKVTNTGDTYAGKEVVEVYFSAPDGDLEKPYQELIGFAKTDLLQPGESQEVKISYLTTEMSSYSEEKAAYIMEAGDYVVRVGNSSRNTHVAAVLSVAETAVTEQLTNILDLNGYELEEISKEGATPYTYDGEADEIAAAAKIELDPAALAASQVATSEEDQARIDAYKSEKITTYLTEDKAADYQTVDNEEVVIVNAVENPTLYQVYSGEVTMEEFVASLDNEQLANIINGNRGVAIPETFVGAQANSVNGAAGETTSLYFESHGIPNIVLADGPAGIRITQSYTNEGETETYYQFCTAWPIGTMMAQSWDTDLVEEVEAAIGAEMVEYGVTLWLAPGMNIHRDPLCGRNFEYYSEDPYLTGSMGTAATLGVQSNPGIGVTIKHYAGNNQEINRNTQNDTVSERTFREIYLKGFEMAVKEAQPMAVMSSYNYINGIYADSNYDILENALRGEWNFQGMVMTDWGAGSRSSISASLHAGNDLTMPGGLQERIINALDPSIEGTENEFVTTSELKDGTIVLGDLQKCATRVLDLLMNSSQFAKLNAEQGVEAVPYTTDAELLTYQTVEKSEATK